MAIARQGKYGVYYGSTFSTSSTLDSEQKKLNAYYIYTALSDKGWTTQSIAGILGNMEPESAINPGRWQGNSVGIGPGYGLVQWTPFSKYTVWCKEQGLADPSEMDNNLARILYELENGLQYGQSGDYPISFSDFTKSTNSPYYLACAFCWNYERNNIVISGTEAQKQVLKEYRGGLAEKWYTYLTQEHPPTPPPVTTKSRKMPLWMYLRYDE